MCKNAVDKYVIEVPICERMSVSVSEVTDIVKKLDNGKSAGPDCVVAEPLNILVPESQYYCHYSFHLCFVIATFLLI